jgi:hypothetical protein
MVDADVEIVADDASRSCARGMLRHDARLRSARGIAERTSYWWPRRGRCRRGAMSQSSRAGPSCEMESGAADVASLRASTQFVIKDQRVRGCDIANLTGDFDTRRPEDPLVAAVRIMWRSPSSRELRPSSRRTDTVDDSSISPPGSPAPYSCLASTLPNEQSSK